MEVDFDKEFRRLLELPQGEYKLPPQNLTRARAEFLGKTVLVGMSAEGVTNARSNYPIIGTYGVTTCTGILIYNPARQKAYVLHDVLFQSGDITNAIQAMRESTDEKLELHMIGALPIVGEKVEAMKRYIKPMLQEIYDQENIEIKTFDIGFKPHPTSFAIDTRDGKLVQGSEMVIRRYIDIRKIEEDSPELAHRLRDRWQDVPDISYLAEAGIEEKGFDGTLPEHRASRSKN